MRLLLVLPALLALTHDVHSARILSLFPHTGKSHQMVFEPLLRRLAERGHHVTVVSFFPIKNAPANYTDVSLQGLAHLGLEVIDLLIYEHPSKLLRMMGLEKIVKQITEFQPLADMALSVCSKLVNFQPLADALKKEYDLIIMENFNSDCMLGLAHVYGQKAPFIYLSSCGLMQWTSGRLGLSDNPSYVPIVSSDFANPMSFFQRLENTFLNIYYKLWFRYMIQLKEKEIIEKHFGKKIPDLQDLSKNVSAVLVNVYHSLYGVKPLLPGVIEVGGMHLDHTRKPIPHYIERFMNESEHGVVLLSFGSLIKTATIPKHKEEMIVRTLSKIKQRVIWKYEDSGEEGTITGNILRVRWLPQYELLQHPKVIAFIGHGGLLGMTEAISAGKPMLVVPFFGDQPYNGASAAAVGFAKVIPYIELTEKSLLEGLQDVLKSMRLTARRASKIWKDRQADPLDTAVYWTERVIRWGRQAPLHSHARDLPLHQYLLLDVAATFIVVIIILAVILRIILVLILRFVSGSVNTKEKLH
ncbi:UDP-glucosyltransferase 2-like [Manduca sexta]|uniref:UDP-glucosyltransferase 2-like n=1 Tax=Manduca sexta TaxID=7130 RepID=UPI00188DFC8A|nr:UDP-glucosyltransferase 2-like [Manduca sexta]